LQQPEAVAVEQHAEHGHHGRRQDQRHPEVAVPRDGVAEVSAEHVERAVREVDDAPQPVDEREARAHDEQQRAVDQAVEEIDGQHVVLSRWRTCAGSVLQRFRN
jgi:hypothetical protein